MSKEKVIDEVKFVIERADSTLEKFNERFKKDPMDAFSWSGESFQASTNKKIFTAILNSLEEDTATFEETKEFILDKILYKAKYPSHSTSAVSNIISECEMVSWSEAYEIFEKRS
jgi:hypothetical protein